MFQAKKKAEDASGAAETQEFRTEQKGATRATSIAKAQNALKARLGDLTAKREEKLQ